MKIVCIDAGHGGKDPGAESGGVQEKDIALTVALKVGARLKDCEVIYTRTEDVYVGLSERALIANQAKADLFVSIHCNSVDDESAHGMEVYVHASRSAASKRAASAIYDRLLPASGLRGRGVKADNFAVLRETKMPAVLIELGFISNSGDRAKLTDSAWQDDAAKAIADGIIEALK